MTILHGLKADLADAGGRWDEPRGILESLHHEVQPGVFVHIGLGTAGLTIRRGADGVGIPIDELLSLAFPDLRPASPSSPPKPPATEGPI